MQKIAVTPVQITTTPQKLSINLISTQEKLVEEEKQKHCILLHGWGLFGMGDNGESMRPVQDAIRAKAPDWNYWLTTFDAHGRSFLSNARGLKPMFLDDPKYNFTNTVFVTYSMGGVVARQMIADGFPCLALATICSPHHGLLGWVPTPDLGSMSVVWRSQDLAALNENSADMAQRNKYHFFAITYIDGRGGHADDGVVESSSAFGEGLGSNIYREHIELQYGGGIVPVPGPVVWDPHNRGKDPQVAWRYIDYCTDLLHKFS